MFPDQNSCPTVASLSKMWLVSNNIFIEHLLQYIGVLVHVISVAYLALIYHPFHEHLFWCFVLVCECIKVTYLSGFLIKEL